MPLLRDVSRQEYLARREADKLAALEDELRDEEFLFAGEGWGARLIQLEVTDADGGAWGEGTLRLQVCSDDVQSLSTSQPPIHPPPPHPGKEHLLSDKERADIAYKRRVLELAKERKAQLESLDQERYTMPASYGGDGCLRCVQVVPAPF